MSILALGALGASGCDDDETTESDGGGGGNGNGNGNDGNGGEPDANGGGNDGTNDGIDGDVPFQGIMCETEACPKTKGGLLQQCCAGEDENVCGLDLTAPGQPSLGCFPEKAPGKASPTCAPVLNAFETMGTKDDKFEIDAGGMIIEFPTCCTAAGVCGVDSGATSLGDLGLGCLAATVLAPPMMSGGDAGGPPAPPTMEPNGLPLIPNVFCDATTGTAATCLPSMVPGRDGTPTKVPPFIKGACAAEVDMTNNCIKNVERNIKGCGADKKWDRVSLQGLCIDNVADTIFGCDDVSATTLGRLPSILCGCGVGRTTLDMGGAAPCLANTALNICGANAGCTGVPTMAMPMPADSCAGPDSCADVAPFTSAKDGVGDACGCQPALDTDGPGDNMPPFDTCNPTGAAAGTAAGAFDCVQVAPGQNRCSCGTVGMIGTCAAGSICTDTDKNMIGDTCVVTPPT